MQYERICRLMDGYAASTTAQVGLAFYDVETGLSYSVNGEKQQPTCSMFKIWLMLTLYRMAERGEVSLEEEWLFTEADKTKGSGVLTALEPGFSMKLWNYVYLMMAYSDNTATDMIYRLVTPERIRKEVLTPLGLAGTKIEVGCREMLEEAYATPNPDGEIQIPDTLSPDGKIITAGLPSYRMTPWYLGETPNDMTTPLDVVKTYRALLDGKILGPEWTGKALDMLCLCETNTRIPRRLPGKKRLRIAHKTGSVDRVCNDGAILMTKRGTYILVLMYNGNTATEKEYAEAYARYVPDNAQADLSLAVYQAYMAD